MSNTIKLLILVALLVFALSCAIITAMKILATILVVALFVTILVYCEAEED